MKSSCPIAQRLMQGQQKQPGKLRPLKMSQHELEPIITEPTETAAEEGAEDISEIQEPIIPELLKRKPQQYSQTFKQEPESPKDEVIFECNICLDTASTPVVTMCGHLYCWPCLNNWLKSGSPTSNTCPVCKSGTTKETVIPIYCKGRTKDPRFF